MIVREVSAADYRNRFPQAGHVFNSIPFASLNTSKVGKVLYLLIEDEGRTRFGLILGERGDLLASPFSAPYGGLEYSRDERIEKVNEAVEAVADFGREKGLPVRLTLPPRFHSPEMNMKITAALLNRPGALSHADYNYHYELSRVTDFEKWLSPSARRNFHTSLKSDFRFEPLGNTPDDISRAYEVIRINHESLGHALRMSRQAVIDTATVLKADFFIMTLDGKDVAAAQIYHVAPGIVQLINWGDLPDYRSLRPMNFMAWKVMEHYHAAGEKIYDLGPASEDGTPATGLCDFKEGLGCSLTMKFTFKI